MLQSAMLGLIRSVLPPSTENSPPMLPSQPPPPPQQPSQLVEATALAHPTVKFLLPPKQPSLFGMPRLSRTPSPLTSPAMGPEPMPTTAPAPVTYIPPLRDGACGTTPRSQQPMWAVIRHEMAQMLHMMPTLGWVMFTQRCRHVSLAHMASIVLHVVLASLEMGMMVMAVPMWVMLPGGVFSMCVGGCAVVVMAMCWMINGREQIYQCSAGSEGWMMGQEVEDEKWMFLGGMGMSSRHCHKKTLPALSRLFSRPIVCICMPTYGVPFDMVAMMLQRCLPIPSQARRTLYSQMRSALLDESLNRCVILSHSDSSIIVSQAVAQLCSDLPMEKMRKLEIYTFGAAACEFVMPLGEVDMDSDAAMERQGIHVEHFAMMNDPFAQMGVLQSVRQNMEGRFCGGIFILNDNMTISNGRAMSTCSGLMMEEYLMELFPIQVSDGTSRRSALDNVMIVDRDCAEKRELAAMSNYHAASQVKRGGKRLSWTGLATMAGQQNGTNAGMVGLEMARKGCRASEGRRGREVSWLMRYAAVDAKPVDGISGRRNA